MGEYLQLVADTLTDAQLRELISQELSDRPNLVEHLQVSDHTITTKLATCEHVFFTFDDMVALVRFIRRHSDALHYGPGHEYNATPQHILSDRSSLYLGPYGIRASRCGTRLVTPQQATSIEHHQVWRKTRRTLSRNGKWYQRKIRRDETTGVPGPNGYRTACPRSGRQFRATRAGFAWDATTGAGREIYRCPSCAALFNLGEHADPHLAELARELFPPAPN